VLARRAEIILALGLAPRIVKACGIVLVDQLALADDHNGMNVRVGRAHAGCNAAQTSAIETDALGLIDQPSIVERSRRPAGLHDWCLLSKRRKSDDRQDQRGSNLLHASPQPVRWVELLRNPS